MGKGKGDVLRFESINLSEFEAQAWTPGDEVIHNQAMDNTPLPVAEPIEDEVLLMRPMAPEDAEAILPMLDDQVKAFVWFTHAPPTDQGASGVREWIEDRNRMMVESHDNCDWAIVDKATGEVVGWRCLRNKIIEPDNPPDGKIRTSVFVSPDQRGRRIAPRSARLAAQFAFDNGLEELLLALEVENEASLKSALAAGFRYVETANGLHRLEMTQADLDAAPPLTGE